MLEPINPPAGIAPVSAETVLGAIPAGLRSALSRLAAVSAAMAEAVEGADALAARLPAGEREAAAAHVAAQKLTVLETMAELQAVVENLARRLGRG